MPNRSSSPPSPSTPPRRPSISIITRRNSFSSTRPILSPVSPVQLNLTSASPTSSLSPQRLLPPSPIHNDNFSLKSPTRPRAPVTGIGINTRSRNRPFALLSLVLVGVIALFTLMGSWETDGVIVRGRPWDRWNMTGSAVGLSVERQEDEDKLLADTASAAEDAHKMAIVAGEAVHQLEEASTALPPCHRTLLFRFANLHGFGSEFALLLRVAVLARHYSYTLLIDSSQWNYGPWDSYFQPLSFSCIPPSSHGVNGRIGGGLKRVRMHTSTEELEAKSEPEWTKSDHVEWRRDVDSLDRLFMNIFSGENEVQKLHEEDSKVVGGSLESGSVVPIAFWEAYKIQSKVVNELWRPNREILRMVNQLGRRVSKSVGDDAGVKVIALHVRLGDKYLEADSIGPQAYSSDHKHLPAPHREAGPGLHGTALSQYFDSATSLINFDSTRSKPTLLIMSDHPDIWKDFQRDPRGKRWRVLGTADEKARGRKGKLGKRGLGGEEDFRGLVERAEIADDDREIRTVIKEKEDKNGGKNKNPFRKTGGFHETAFNKLPLSTRISLTKIFVRDVTFLAIESDGLVLSASSNVGRLMTVLIGENRVQDVRSVDTRWFPTARFI